MSNCLVLQGKNFIAIGADTASSVLIDGKYRRIGTDSKKLYRFGNEIMFCSGRMTLVELVTSNIAMKDNKIVLDDLTNFIESLNIQKADTYDLEILICGVENDKSYMHQISQYNDFEVKTITNDTSGCAVYSTGFNAKTMLDTAKKNYPLCQNISNLFTKSFADISSDEIGGYINMYLMKENQITKCVNNYKVDDIKTISVSNNDIHFVIADCLIGDLIFGKTLHINNGKDTLTMDENGLTITNGVNTIVFDPNNTELMNVTNNDKKIFYLNELGDLFIDGNIFGGSLHLENENGVYVDINPDKDNIMEIAKNDGEGNSNTTTNEYPSEPVDYGFSIFYQEEIMDAIALWCEENQYTNAGNFSKMLYDYNQIEDNCFYAKYMNSSYIYTYFSYNYLTKEINKLDDISMYDFENDYYQYERFFYKEKPTVDGSYLYQYIYTDGEYIETDRFTSSYYYAYPFGFFNNYFYYKADGSSYAIRKMNIIDGTKKIITQFSTSPNYLCITNEKMYVYDNNGILYYLNLNEENDDGTVTAVEYSEWNSENNFLFASEDNIYYYEKNKPYTLNALNLTTPTINKQNIFPFEILHPANYVPSSYNDVEELNYMVTNSPYGVALLFHENFASND